MRAFSMCAVLTVATLTAGAATAQAHDVYVCRGYHRYYYRPEIVIRPAPIVIAPAPLVVVPAPPAPLVVGPTVIAPVYGPAPVYIAPRPVFSIRLGIR